MTEFKDLDYPISKNFRLREFAVSKTYPDLAEKITFTIQDVLMLMLHCLQCAQPIRDKFGPQICLSGKRDLLLNRKVGGAEDSDHMFCMAGDYRPLNFSCDQVFRWIVEESGIPYRQVIYYPEDGFYHISNNSPLKPQKKEALVCITQRGSRKYIPYNQYYEKKGDGI